MPNMKLVKQYVIVRGKMQPALKYVVPQPLINKYEISHDEAIKTPLKP